MTTKNYQLEMFRKGERVRNAFTLSPSNFTRSLKECAEHDGRVVVCTSVIDIKECVYCGHQWEAACCFEDDVSRVSS